MLDPKKDDKQKERLWTADDGENRLEAKQDPNEAENGATPPMIRFRVCSVRSDGPDHDEKAGTLADDHDHNHDKRQVPCDYIPKRSYLLLQTREVLRLLAEEGIKGSVKEVEQRGDGV